MTPTLSLILCSRNDRYMGNPVWRLQTALNYVAARVAELKRETDVEILVTDWGSDVPLHTVLRLTPAAARLTRFVVVPKPLAKALQKDSHFSEVHALNAAARRARGQYIGRIDQDTLVGTRFLQGFFDIAEGRKALEVPPQQAIFFANRRSIPYRFAVRCPALGHVERFVRTFGAGLKVWDYNGNYPELYWTSFVGISLYHRSLWTECGGYDERLIYYDWMEVDMILRLRERHPIVNLGRLVDYDFYHLDHYLLRASWSAALHPRETGKANPNIDMNRPPAELHPNRPSWGIMDESLAVVQAPAVIPAGAGPGRTAFAWLLATIWLTMASDTVMVWAVNGTLAPLRWLVRLSPEWKRRADEAKRTVIGLPFVRWPGLLARHWSRKG